ncbi:MAG: hypothetical protein VX438_13570, partial [Planctomycetota bacterium]|nr:hypothetical protein [Planctomycetota bacterium]
MSRARLFQRAANWLKNCIKTKQQVQQRKDRRRAFKFAFGQLEERVVLDADFTFTGVDLLMDNYSSLGGESLDVSETNDYYNFTLSEGVWSGADSPTVFGDGTNTLSVEKNSSGIESLTSDGAGIDLNFQTIDFDAAGTLIDLDFAAGDISQTGAINADFVSSIQFAGGEIDLSNTGNNFNFAVLNGSTVLVDDKDDITIELSSTGAAVIESAGEINIADSSVDSGVLRVNSLANGGTGADINIDSTSAFNMIINAGVGNVDGNDAANDFNFVKVEAAGQADFYSLSTINLRDISANKLSVDAENIQIVGNIATNSTLLNSADIIKTSTGSISTSELSILSTSNTALDAGTNSIGSLAGSIGGDFDLVNATNLNIEELTFTLINGTPVTTTGLDVTGDVDVEMVDLALTGLAPLAIGGSFDLTLGTGTADLMDLANDLNTFNIVSASQVDLAEQDSVSITGASLTERLAILAANQIELVGDVSASDQLLLGSASLVQTSGIITTAGLMLGGDDGILMGQNEVGSAGVAGLFSAQTTGDVSFQNVFAIDVADQTYSLLNGSPATVNGLSGTNIAIYTDGLTASSTNYAVDNLLVNSSAGASLPAINLEELLLAGTGTFEFLGSNEISHLAGDLDGHLLLNNDIDLEIADLTLLTEQIVGLSVTGDWGLSLSGDDLTQSADTTVGNFAAFYLDSAGSAYLNHSGNDFNSIEVLSSNEFTLRDTNGLSITGAQGTQHHYTTGDLLTLDGDVDLNGGLALSSANGVQQLASTYVSALELIVEGQGEFNLTEANQIGDATAAGKLAADIDGSLALVNDFGLQVDNLTFPFADGTSADVSGVRLGTDGGVHAGDLTIDTAAGNGNLGQEATANVVVEGVTQVDVGTGDVLLARGDTDADGNSNNDFESVYILAATNVEIADIDDITIEQADATNALSVTAGADIQLNNTIEVVNLH